MSVWMELNEIVDWDRTTEPWVPKTNPILVKQDDLCLMRPQVHGAEIRVRDTWVYVTEKTKDIFDILYGRTAYPEDIPF